MRNIQSQTNIRSHKKITYFILRSLNYLNIMNTDLVMTIKILTIMCNIANTMIKILVVLPNIQILEIIVQ